MDLASIFDCKMCGTCCIGRGGIVVSPTDLQRLATYLNLRPSEFVERYTEHGAKKLKLRTAENGACVFFCEDKGCMIHAAKPVVCRAWPFFKGNLVDPISFSMAKDYCPGINKDVTHQNFAEIGLKYLRDTNLLAKNAATEANALSI